MGHLIDSCIWVDHLRPKTNHHVRLLADEVIRRSSIVLCEPIQFELLRLAPQSSRNMLDLTLSIIPMLQTPVSLWRDATRNGQRCRDKGIQTGSLDLLIATICQHHHVTLVTFDAAFEKIADVIGFQLELIKK